MIDASPHPRESSNISGARRTYNQWAANETLEDFALRFTARRARRWSYGRVANTALGSISFLALEAIGAAITLSYGFDNAVVAILIVGAILFLTGLPISYHAAKAGVDIDLLTRGAGFGYIGSTFTSLIYATFTFLFFALEAVILSLALELFFGVPLWIGYLLNALIVIPLVTHGFTRIGTFQKLTQPLWIILQVLPFVALAVIGAEFASWQAFTGRLEDAGGGFDIILCAAASGVALALMAQIGEQVDFLRFLPEPTTRTERRKWWAVVIAAGPGWAVIGTLKMLAGSYLAVMLVTQGATPSEAVDPTRMYLAAYERFMGSDMAVACTALLVLLAQVKINVTNAYAGSIAWSNFFSRLTHSHPGRVVWLIFNVAIAVLLMQLGVFGALEETLGLYAHIAVAWIGALTADLVINRTLGLRPQRIEFRRGNLFDINPVGVVGTLSATALSVAAYLGLFGQIAAAFSGFIALAVALTVTPLVAWWTGGQFYLARRSEPSEASGTILCGICENPFDGEDMIACPFHGASICSLCCGLESGCGDLCRPGANIGYQAKAFAAANLPLRAAAFLTSRYGVFLATAAGFITIIGLLLLMVRYGGDTSGDDAGAAIDRLLLLIFGLLSMVIGVAVWLLTLAQESRYLATEERERETSRLQAEIRAHRRTDHELQQARDIAEAASNAKSRYIAGISHELRTPLNAILGYAQLLENDPTTPGQSRPAIRVMRRSSEHLADLIEGLLDISKIEAGKLELSRDEIGLRELVDQMAAIFRMQAGEKGLCFVYAPSHDLPERAYADERRLRQILTNLLSNALRYTQAGEVRFCVDYRSDVAIFTIEDTGRGIAREEHERIFMPFERIEDPASPLPGTGLGLTIAKLLTELLGGEMTLSSSLGHGSCFQVRLMLPRIATTKATEPHRRLFGYRGPRRRLLIVDDNHEHRTLLEDILRPLGFELSMAETGEAALRQAEAARPDLALLDVAMPGMSGWTLAAKLRTEFNLDAPIIMVSAHADHAVAMPDGVSYHDDFITKPLNLDLLLSRIQRHLSLEWLEDEPHRGSTPSRRNAPGRDLDAIEDLLAIGYVRGLKEALAAINTDRAEHAAFVAQAERHMEALDFEQLGQLVREARNA